MICSSQKSRADSRSFCWKHYRRARFRLTLAQRMATAARRDPAARDPACEAFHLAGETRNPTGEARDPAGEARDPAGEARDPAREAKQRRDSTDATRGPQAMTFTLGWWPNICGHCKQTTREDVAAHKRPRASSDKATWQRTRREDRQFACRWIGGVGNSSRLGILGEWDWKTSDELPSVDWALV